MPESVGTCVTIPKLVGVGTGWGGDGSEHLLGVQFLILYSGRVSGYIIIPVIELFLLLLLLLLLLLTCLLYISICIPGFHTGFLAWGVGGGGGGNLLVHQRSAEM